MGVRVVLAMVEAGNQKIVLLEANQSRRDYLRSMISGWGYAPIAFEKESICLDNLPPLNPDLIISGSLNNEKAYRFINSIKMIKSDLPILILSGNQNIQDYVKSNEFYDVVIVSNNSAPAQIKTAIVKSLKSDGGVPKQTSIPLIIGNSRAIATIKNLVSKLSHSKDTVLISGETGTGKKLIARAIHGKSTRSSGPFVKLNAVMLPYQLLEGELFGIPHLFGDAISTGKKGIFAVADTGTLFIKEITALPWFLQAKLLQVIEEGYLPSQQKSGEEKIDLRVIASTSKNIKGLVKSGRFRNDLFYRINVLNINLTPLRSRIADIPALTDFFTVRYCSKFNKSHYRISDSTKEIFCRYPWPGNIRELKQVVRQIVLRGNENGIVSEILKARRQSL